MKMIKENKERLKEKERKGKEMFGKGRAAAVQFVYLRQEE
jgi:hypothetical protein